MDMSDVVGYKDNTWIRWVRDREELMSLISLEDVKSNRNDYIEAFKTCCDFEDQRYKNAQKRKRIYAVTLDVLFPRNAHEKEIDGFVGQLMESLDPDYLKDIPYVYYSYRKGNGEYIKIIALQRIVYEKPIVTEKKYTRDYVYDQKTGKVCSCSNPNAIIRKKGDTVVKNGKPVMIIQTCSSKKNRCFNYKNPSDKEIQPYFHLNMVNEIHEKVRNALNKISNLRVGKAKNVKKEKKANSENIWQQVKRIKYNTLVTKINRKLSFYCYLVEQGKLWLELDELNELKKAYYTCANSIKAIFTNKSFKDGKLIFYFNIEARGDSAKRLSLTQFSDNLTELVNYLITNKFIECEKAINNVLGKVFTDLTLDTYKL